MQDTQAVEATQRGRRDTDQSPLETIEHRGLRAATKMLLDAKGKPLEPIEAAQAQRVHEALKAPAISEEDRIAADLHYNAYKNSGQLLRDQIYRAHFAEIDAGMHKIHDPFEGVYREVSR